MVKYHLTMLKIVSIMKKYVIKEIYKRILNRIYNPFLYTNIKPQTLELQKNDKCLVIAPHPDDESIGCGGILKLYADNFSVISLTHGNKNDIRYSEMHKAMSFAGIKELIMLNLQDKDIISGQKKFNEINISEYDYIFIPYIFDQHKDHKAVSILLNEKLKDKNHKKNLKIAFYEVWSTINMPQYYVNITSVAEDKKKMINFHKSQIAVKNYADKILGLNSYRGLLRNLGAVESFSVLDVNDFQNIVPKIVFNAI